MKEISNWVAKNNAYIVIMKNGMQHSFISSSVQKEWIIGNAGVVKTVCLYEEDDENRTLKLIVDNQDVVHSKVSGGVPLFLKQFLLAGPEMVIRTSEISVMERSKTPAIETNCFTQEGGIMEEVLASQIPELKSYWSENGFTRFRKVE